VELKDSLLNDKAVLTLIGNRIAAHRINQNRTQSDLADEAGIGKRTLERIESGVSTQLISVIRVMRALGIIENIKALIPDMGPSPIQELRRQSYKRQRASLNKKNPSGPEKWTWGENE